MLGYQNERLCLGRGASGIDIAELVAERRAQRAAEEEERPFYLYHLGLMRSQAESLRRALGPEVGIHYAVKANSHPGVIAAFARSGLGADVVSGGELMRALESGVPARQILFSGVGKTRHELQLALKKDVLQINIESLPELKRLIEMAEGLGRRARVALRINPDVNAETHPYITTGFRENKFGIDTEMLGEAVALIKRYEQHIDFQGLTIHIGSQLTRVDDFRAAIQKTLSVIRDLHNQGLPTRVFDIGGGLGIDYQRGRVDGELLAAYGQMVRDLVATSGLKILTEPGRILTACSGVLLAQVQYVKRTPHKNFVIVNTGMHHLMRPALYQAYHRILPLSEVSGGENFDVVGPICESADVLGKERALGPVQEDDWLAIGEAGAYGLSMASGYNLHELPDEVLIDAE